MSTALVSYTYRALLVGIVGFACILPVWGAVDQEVIYETGFEVDAGSRPRGWSPHSGVGIATWDGDMSRSGSRALMISAVEGGTVKWESDRVLVDPAGLIEVSAWLKVDQVVIGENLWNKAVVRCSFFSGDDRKLSDRDLVRDEGSSDWTNYVAAIPVPGEAKYLVLSFYLAKAGGRAWLDDISVKRLPKYVGRGLLDSPGKERVDIVVNPEQVVGVLSGVNGIFYERTAERFSGVADLQPTIVRIPPVSSHHYHLFPGNDDKKDIARINWVGLDRDLRNIVNIGAVPFVSIGWVPEKFKHAIARRDYSGWKKFVHDLVDRYSKMYDVSGWYWNFWNEPSIYRVKGEVNRRVNWYGSEMDFYEFYAETVEAALSANEHIKIGGAGFAMSSPWLSRFIRWCGISGTRVDFVSWHSYGEVPSLLAAKVSRVKDELRVYPHLSRAEIILDEWSSYSEGGRESSKYYRRGNYAAAYRVSAIGEMLAAGVNGNIWFNMYDDEYGLYVHGVRQPAFNTFEMLSRLGSRRVSAVVTNEDPYIGAIAGLDASDSLGILVSYFKHVADRSPEIEKRVVIKLPDERTKRLSYSVYLIDESRSNGFADARRESLEAVHRGIIGADGYIILSMRPNSVMLIKAE